VADLLRYRLCHGYTPRAGSAAATSSKPSGGRLITYNHPRRRAPDYMRGRTAHQILTNHPTQLAS
jgi:hypothetical protein